MSAIGPYERPEAVVVGAFGRDSERRFALDRAHRGDIQGAFGTVSSLDVGPRRSHARKLATLLTILGPGVLVMAADNDAGGLATYAQAGQQYGTRLVPLLALLAGVIFVNQEMVSRLGAVTGAGHARLIVARFGRRWGESALGDLLLLNLLVLVTEFVGVSLSLAYFGISRFISVPCAAALLIGATATGSFRRWERAMYFGVVGSLVGVPLVVLAVLHRHVAAIGPAGHTPHADGVLLVIALIGTTVAPWQIFFQQSNVVDKRITPRFLNYERADTAVGTVVFAVGAVAILLACAFAFGGTPLHGSYTDAAGVAAGLSARVGRTAGDSFAVALLCGSLVGASVVTLGSSYAIGDFFELRHSLHRRWGTAPVFHRTYAATVAVAAGVVLLPGLPLGLVTTAVQALAGVLLPSATVFLLLLSNDAAVLGPWVNPRWLNRVAVTVVGLLIGLSLLLTVTTAFPGIPVAPTATAIGAALAVVLAAMALVPSAERQRDSRSARATGWTMPPLERLPPPVASRARTAGLVLLRCYLFLAVGVLAIRVLRVAIGS